MEKANHRQLELFSNPGFEAGANEAKSRRPLSGLWKYEKAVLITMAFVITAVASFCAGVAKGKEGAALKSRQKFDVAEKKQKPPAAVTAGKVSPPVAPAQELIQVVPKAQNYTIQLASYQTANYANKEAERLKKKGFSPLVIPKGSFKILCVGYFATPQSAAPMLAELRKKYRDCFIRRL